MSIQTSSEHGETRSYRDPAGRRISAAAAAKAARESRFPKAAQTYDGFYLPFTPLSGKDVLLAGPQGIIGSPYKLDLIPKDQKDAVDNPEPLPPLTLTTLDGQPVAELRGDGAIALRQHLGQGWELHIVLSLVFYCAAEQSFTGELACICFDPVLGEAMREFARNIDHRIMRGTRPGLALSQEQFMRVLESKGAWYLTKEVPMPEKASGVVVYKRRKLPKDYLIAEALKGNLGCKVVSYIFWIAVLAGVVALIWWLLH